MKMGAFDYVTKPIHPEEILVTVKKALESSSANEQDSQESKAKGNTKTSNKKSPSKQKESQNSPRYVKGTGPRSQSLQKLISLVAPTDMTVVITGESGTGKEVTARTIHEQSQRADKPMVAVDCGALPKELAGSILFGHLKGSFTGALKDKIGHFQAADGGTLFLDEVGNLSYENQIKLLRVLQERQIQRIGESKDIKVDVRVIAATNENLRELVQEGKFREDLFYRLNEFSLELPALRERQEDIEEIASVFAEDAAQEFEKEFKGIDKKVLDAFRQHHWPGNIRELKNVMKRATLLTTSATIEMDAIPVEIQNPGLYQMEDSPINVDNLDLRQVAEKAEKKAIIAALKKTGMNKSKTAELLNVDRKTLYNKIKAYGIEIH
jgi:two-component system response regulator HydG